MSQHSAWGQFYTELHAQAERIRELMKNADVPPVAKQDTSALEVQQVQQVNPPPGRDDTMIGGFKQVPV